MFKVFILALLCVCTLSLQISMQTRQKVLVTGGAGRTGKLVVSKLLQSDTYQPVAVVRTQKSAQKLTKLLKKDKHITPEALESLTVLVGDICDAQQLEIAFKSSGAKQLILCTSAVPAIKKRSLIPFLFKKLILRSKNPGRPTFRFPNGQPYAVDYEGALNQYRAASKAGVEHVVVISSMGSTQPENFLNTIGRIDGDEKTGNILLWKREAEKKLLEYASGDDASMKYTIIHPGGLIDQPGGQREIVFGVDDKLLENKVRNIPRADVAEVCIQSLDTPQAFNRAFDIISKPVDTEGAVVTKDWTAWFTSNQGNCVY